jgi:hypothetical protein
MVIIVSKNGRGLNTFDELSPPDYICPAGRNVNINHMTLFMEGIESGFFSFEDAVCDSLNIPLMSKENKKNDDRFTQAETLREYTDFCNSNNIPLYLTANDVFSEKNHVFLILKPVKAALLINREHDKSFIKKIEFADNTKLDKKVEEEIDEIINEIAILQL